jgi:hypothetical protein
MQLSAVTDSSPGELSATLTLGSFQGCPSLTRILRGWWSDARPRSPIQPHNDQLTRVTRQLPARFFSIHKWLPRACLGVESSAEENVVL